MNGNDKPTQLDITKPSAIATELRFAPGQWLTFDQYVSWVRSNEAQNRAHKVAQ